MKAWLAVIVSLVAMGCLDVRASKPQTWSTTLTWKLSLDAGGQITGLSLAQNPDQIPHKSVAETIRKWKFSPGQLDGVPTATDTWLRTTLAGQVVKGKIALGVEHASTGPSMRMVQSVRYPEALARAHLGGLVVLDVHFDKAGDIVSITPVEIAEKKTDPLFLNAATAAVKTWKFKPESVGGFPVEAIARVPVCFKARPADRCQWKDAISNTTHDGFGLVSLNPAAKLLTDVTGKVM